MAEEGAAATLAATDLSSRSRSGSSSGSSESDVSPICKISPLVVPVSSSTRPLTPKKRHRAEMEEEARRQEALLAAERAKAESETKTLTSSDTTEEEQDLDEKRIPELEANVPAEAESTSPSTPSAEAETAAEVKVAPTETDHKRQPVKKRKAGEDSDGPDSVVNTPVKRRAAPKKTQVAKSPAAPKSPKTTPRTPPPQAVVTATGDEPLVPEGWRRVVTQRMQGGTAGRFDVYIWSPTGKKFRSRPQLHAYLEETGSSLSIDDFSFKHTGSSATPARFRKLTTPVKLEKKKKKTTPKKKTVGKSKVQKVTPKRGRPRKNSAGGTKSPGKQAVSKAKKGKQQRKVMKPPPDTGSKKASRAQQLQKLLVKINFQKPGDIREMSEDESSEEDSEDDFDPGTTEEAGPDVSDVSSTPSPPSSKKGRRHSSPIV
ncbi:methyl-CpG-binding domain protein 4-like [Acanthaster planci]|uniref:Methyl-CpG-binding domain protein 4-like n=1 Tax=Acanthaster planci TaxID=133434 RepID=A0A8B7ZA15_ACAPL|nr:methyl-CpG-binding domain protein 4-like [Acanthaster planci]